MPIFCSKLSSLSPTVTSSNDERIELVSRAKTLEDIKKLKTYYKANWTDDETIYVTFISKNKIELTPEIDVDCVIEKIKEAGYKKVVLRPLMVVAGDHANNDMAGDDEDSWKSQFEASGVFDSIDTQIAGLGEIDAIQQLYVAHTQAAIDAE